MDKYAEVEKQVIDLVSELTNYFDGYYLGVEHAITNIYLLKIKDIIEKDSNQVCTTLRSK